MNLFSRAAAGLNLTPGERAFLKLLASFGDAGLAAVLAAAPAILAYLSGQQAITWAAVAFVAAFFVHGFMVAWRKYVSAKGDAPLATVIGEVDAAAQRALGQPNAVKTLADDVAAPVPAPAPAPVAAATPVPAQPA